MTGATRDQLRAIGRHVATLEAPGFRFGSWVLSRPTADGVTQMPWYEPSPAAEAFLADARALVRPFDWPTWAAGAEGQALLADPDAVASASAEDLGRLVTTYVRAERFGDGTLENAFVSGMLTAIARRAAALAEGDA